MIVKSFHLFESNSDEIMNEIRSILLKMGLEFTLRYRNRGSRKPDQDDLELIVLLKENNLSFPKNWIECLNLNFIQKIESSTPYQYCSFFQFGSTPNSLYIELKNRERKSSKYESPDIWGKREDYGDYVFLDEYFKMLDPSPPDVVQFMEDISLEWVDNGYSFGCIFEIKPYLSIISGQSYYYSDDSRHSDWTKDTKSRPKIYLNHGGEFQYLLRFSSDLHSDGFYKTTKIVNEFISPFLKRLNQEYGIDVTESRKGITFDKDFNPTFRNHNDNTWHKDNHWQHSIYIRIKLKYCNVA